MFSKSQRFVEGKPSDIPGPGAYNPKDLAALGEELKRGAFLEKADRFDKNRVPDGPGPNAYNSTTDGAVRGIVHKGASTAHLKQQLAEAHRALAAQKADLARLEKLERRCDGLDAERKRLEEELRAGAGERREAKIREASLKAALEKAQAKLNHVQERAIKLEPLQKKLDELTDLHAKSAAKRDAELQRICSELSDAQESSTRSSAQLAEQADELTQLRSELASAQSTSSSTSDLLVHASTLLSDLSDAYSTLSRTTVPAAQHDALRAELLAWQDRALRAERKLGEKDAVVQAFVEVVGEEKALRGVLEDALRGAEEEVSFLRSRNQDMPPPAPDDIPAEPLEPLALASEEEALYASHLDLIQADLTSQVSSAQSSLSSALTFANSLSTFLLPLLAFPDSLSAAQAELAQAREDLARAQAELQPQVETTKHLSLELGKTRALSTSLQEEVSQLQSYVSHLLPLEAELPSLQAQLDLLLSRTNLAESEAAELGALNARLAGHRNPDQRIHHLSNLRMELSELKQKHLATEHRLKATEQALENARTELESYKSIGGSFADGKQPKAGMSRVRRLNAAGAGVQPLGLSRSVNAPVERVAGAKEKGKEGELTVEQLGRYGI